MSVEVIEDQNLFENTDLIIFKTIIISIDSSQILPDKTVILKDGKIVMIVPLETTQIDERNEKELINIEEKYLMLGMSDMESHINMKMIYYHFWLMVKL